MSNIRNIPIESAKAVADDLENLARDLRAGDFPFEAKRALVVISGPMPGREDGVGCVALGADSSVVQVVGMLETAKFNALNMLRSDGE